MAIYLSELTLANFRTLRSAELRLGRGLNVVGGPSAEGRAAIGEALCLLSIGKPLGTAVEREVVHRDLHESGGGVSAVQAVAHTSLFTTKSAVEIKLGVAPRGRLYTQKLFRINGVACSALDFVGNNLVVHASARSAAHHTASSKGRRRFIDILVSQTDKQYLKNISRYAKTLEQRTRLLRMVRAREAAPEDLHFWNDRLAYEGARVMVRRLAAVRELGGLVEEVSAAAGVPLPPALRYVAGTKLNPGPNPSLEALQAALRREFEAAQRHELRSGRTLRGVQADDLSITSKGASPQLTALLLLLGAGRYIRAVTSERPILALGDALGGIETPLAKRLIDLFGDYDQVVVSDHAGERVGGVLPAPDHRIELLA